jgi:hypothetical protein
MSPPHQGSKDKGNPKLTHINLTLRIDLHHRVNPTIRSFQTHTKTLSTSKLTDQKSTEAASCRLEPPEA